MKALLILIFASLLFAQDNSLSIQGVLRQPSGKAVADGNYSITFSFYTVEVGGSPIANGIKIQNVEIKDGLYNANVDISGIPFNAQYYIGIKVGSDPELAPRAKLTAAPYALSLRGLTNVFPSTGTVSVGDSLNVKGAISMPNTGVIRRGTGNVVVSDLGLYSMPAAGTMRFVTNNGEFHWHTNAGSNPSGSDFRMLLKPNGDLQIGGSMNFSNSGAIQRGGTMGQVGALTADLGLYSLVPNHFVRFVTNNGEFLWYSDAGTNAAGGTEIMRLQSNGFLKTSNWMESSTGVKAPMLQFSSATDINVRRIIAGQINSNGSKASGNGFSSTRSNTGVYTITFNAGFGNTSFAVTATVSDPGAGRSDNMVSIDVKNQGYVVIRTSDRNNYNLPEDTAFDFIIIAY